MAGCTGALIVSLNHRAVTSDSKADMIDCLHSQVCQVCGVKLCLSLFVSAVQASAFIYFLLKRVRVVWDSDLERLKSLGLFAQGFKCGIRSDMCGKLTVQALYYLV